MVYKKLVPHVCPTHGPQLDTYEGALVYCRWADCRQICVPEGSNKTPRSHLADYKAKH